MRAAIECWDGIERALVAAGVEAGDPSDGVIYGPPDPGDGWDGVLSVLTTAFELSRIAAQNEAPVVYVVRHDDLLGRQGPGRAMVATGLLSAARTLAFEGRKKGVPCNVLAVEDDTSDEAAAHWVASLLERDGPSGELVRMGSMHVGKALP